MRRGRDLGASSAINPSTSSGESFRNREYLQFFWHKVCKIQHLAGEYWSYIGLSKIFYIQCCYTLHTENVHAGIILDIEGSIAIPTRTNM